MKKRVIIGVLSGAILVGAIVLRMTKKEIYAMPVPSPVLSTARPEIKDIELTTSLVGTVEPSEVVYVYPKAAGEVTAVHIKIGDYVEQGQVICSIDTKQVDAAKNSLDSAGLSLKTAREELNRQQVLYSIGGISQQAYEQYVNNVEQARLQYESAKTTYDNQVEYASITAPISGLVETVNVEVFDQRNQSDLICVISGAGNKVVSFLATERIMSHLNIGDTIAVQKDNKEYQGIIYELSTMADANTGLYQVKADLTEEGDWPTGSTVRLTVTTEQAGQVMAVPVNAIYFESGEAFVYCYKEGPENVNEGVLTKLKVETGIYDSSSMEIISGLTMDQQVITTWSSELYDGANVRLAESAQQEG